MTAGRQGKVRHLIDQGPVKRRHHCASVPPEAKRAVHPHQHIGRRVDDEPHALLPFQLEWNLQHLK